MHSIFDTRPLLVLVLSLLVAPAGSAQELDMARGDSLRAEGDLRGAIMSYYAALANADPAKEDAASVAYALARTYALSPQHADSAFRYLNVALESEEGMRPLHDADLYFLTKDERWAGVEDRQLDKLAAQVTGSFDRDYARALLRARMNEWGYRYHIMLAFRKLGPESPILSALSDAMQEHHAQNEVAITALLREKGWPRLSAVGEEAAYAAGNVINHSDLTTRQTFLPLLAATCEEGEADWSRYAHILDRTELELGRPQVFGTQMQLNETTGVYEPQPMIDPDDVDRRRAEKGMEPIAAQLKRFNESMKRDFGG